MRVPLVDLAAQQREIDAEVRAGLDQVFASTGFIGGPIVTEFEVAYARFLDAQFCVGVANGTDALELALRAVEVGPGDEVILPANTFIATAEAVSRVGAKPVLVDVDERHLLIDPNAVRAALSTKTAAIMPVHLFGQVAPMEELAKVAADAGVPIVEDAAQSQGARRNGRSAGTFGAVAGTSFYPGKNLGAAGDAGAVITNDSGIARTVRLLSTHGSETKYVHLRPGFNSRLDAVQAVVLKAKLARLEEWNERRRAAAARYSELLSGLPGVVLPASAEGNEDAWHLYVVQVAERDRILAGLHEAGIGAGIHYPTPVHLTQAYAALGYGRGAFPVSEEAADHILSLPLYPHLAAEQSQQVADAFTQLLQHG